MKLFKLLIILLSIHISSTANNDSTIFFRPIDYLKVFEVAKEENKPVMLYFHFDQCGACRKMEKSVFTDKKVVEFYNKNFVSFEINTRKGKGIETNKIYNIKMHPSFIFLDENGEELNKIVGAFSPDDFIDHAKNALDPKKKLTYFKQLYKQGNRDSEFLLDYCYRLNDANELDSLVINEYLSTQSKNDLSKEENVKFIYEFMLHSHQVCIETSHEAFKFMSENRHLFTSYFELDQIETRLMFATSKNVYDAIKSKNEPLFLNRIESLQKFDGKEYKFKEIWGGVTRWTTNKEPSLFAKMYFYKTIGNDEKHREFTQLYIDKIWDDHEALNSFAWDVYLSEKASELSIEEKELLIPKALKCVQRSVDIDQNYNNTDTFASLLFISKKFDQALTIAEEAIEIAKNNNRDFSETTELIKKIKKALMKQ